MIFWNEINRTETFRRTMEMSLTLFCMWLNWARLECNAAICATRSTPGVLMPFRWNLTLKNAISLRALQACAAAVHRLNLKALGRQEHKNCFQWGCHSGFHFQFIKLFQLSVLFIIIIISLRFPIHRGIAAIHIHSRNNKHRNWNN